jgi:hypothetical protein
MAVFNYGSYARAFELGISNPNMTKIARSLFEPIFDLDGVFNRAGNPYTMNSTMAKAWYNHDTDIPENVKNATGRQELIDSIGDYFAAEILDVVTNQNQESQMYSAMLRLIRNSDLQQDQQAELLSMYEDGEKAEFLGRAFLYAVVADNTKTEPDQVVEPVDEDIRKFKDLIKRDHPKPKAIKPPKEIQDHEIGYVKELYRVYHQLSGEDYARPEDLNGQPRLRKNFDRQRKDYYLAETIHRELRDTYRIDEEDGFHLLKDEVLDGVSDTVERSYDTGFDRMTAVMEQASALPLSNNLQDRTLDWVGPGEKKGVCHMLVNDEEISWMEGFDGTDTDV